jgi:hypothetical protein
MPRFFFDFRQAGVRTRDLEGIEFATVEEAYLEAVKGAREMWGDLLHKRQDPRRCSFEVRSEDDQLLFIFPFQELLDSCTDRQTVTVHHSFDQLCASANAAKRANDAFRSELIKLRDSLKESRALLASEI